MQELTAEMQGPATMSGLLPMRCAREAAGTFANKRPNAVAPGRAHGNKTKRESKTNERLLEVARAKGDMKTMIPTDVQSNSAAQYTILKSKQCKRPVKHALKVSEYTCDKAQISCC